MGSTSVVQNYSVSSQSLLKHTLIDIDNNAGQSVIFLDNANPAGGDVRITQNSYPILQSENSTADEDTGFSNMDLQCQFAAIDSQKNLYQTTTCCMDEQQHAV